MTNTSKGNKARTRSPLSTMAPLSTLLVALCLISPDLLSVVNADWIDPDTPKDAYATWALPAHPPPVHPDSSTDKDGSSKNCTGLAGKNLIKCQNYTAAPTTEIPTAAPTPTPEPREYKLVMSDEFNTPGRTFEDGADPKWTSIHKNDYTNSALQFYHSDNAYTNDEGQLVIETEARDTEFVGYDDVRGEIARDRKHFRSAMLQSWNKFCFTGGVVEAEVVLPGRGEVGGLWPAFWLLGNLARHTYVGSAEQIWPWSVTECTQKSRDSQAISGCDRAAHWDLRPGTGRGSPEIDIFEVQSGNIKAHEGVFKYTYVGQPFMSASYQVAPGIAFDRPGKGLWPGPGQWYDGLVGGNESALNILFYGSYNHYGSDADSNAKDYWSDAISYNRQLRDEHFARTHKYRVEWEVPDNETGNPGYLHWFLNDRLVLKLNGTVLADQGLGTEISSEPSYILMNTAVSSQWGFPGECPSGCPCKKYDCRSRNWKEKCGFPEGFCDMLKNESSKYRVNYVRVYQDPNDPKQKVGCSTPERPTRRYIEAHEDRYKQAGDDVPLRGIRNGGGKCDGSSSASESDDDDEEVDDEEEVLSMPPSPCIPAPRTTACISSVNLLNLSESESEFDDDNDDDDDGEGEE
uniref:GH16 domain-containing protein n=1 Tax=Odontella aurita TaxID=265563 RepID=A0A7S4JAL0_9STRA